MDLYPVWMRLGTGAGSGIALADFADLNFESDELSLIADDDLTIESDDDLNSSGDDLTIESDDDLEVGCE